MNGGDRRRAVRALVVGLVLSACSEPPGLAPAWQLTACFANQPGVSVIEAFRVDQVSDLFPRMRAFDRDQIGDGTDERAAFVVRIRGHLKIEQPAVGPLRGHTFERDDPTCLLVLAPDGTFPAGETPLFLGPIGGG